MFAQIYVPVCQWCAEYEPGSWTWWLKGCWMYDCPPEGVAVMAAGVSVAAFAAVQLWAKWRQPKA